MKNKMVLKLSAVSENEAFARAVVASFCVPLCPSLEEINDIKTAVSEAVTNSVVHAYPNRTGDIEISVELSRNSVYITIADFGVGISDVDRAIQPFYTTKPEQERSGMGFTVMEGFMDTVQVKSKAGAGVRVTMSKKIGEKLEAVGV